MRRVELMAPVAFAFPPKGGGATWYSDAILVTGGAEYLFRCAMRREGMRHWAHACEVNWVATVFHDAAGNPVRRDPELDQPLIVARTRHTPGWVEGWRALTAPATAHSLRVGFRITRGEIDTSDPYGFRRFWHGDIDSGEWWIDDVRLERMPLPLTPGKGVSVHPPPWRLRPSAGCRRPRRSDVRAGRELHLQRNRVLSCSA